MIEKSIPNIYIDTNICRDCIKGRDKETIHLMGLIRDNKWKCFTSVFTAMEFTDTEKDAIFFNKKIRLGWDINKILRLRQQKDISREDLKEAENVVKSFFDEYKFIEFVNIEDVNLEENEAWNLALKISSSSNLSAPDVIHLVTAWQSKCDIIITSDEFFIKEGNEILKKEKVWNKLRVCKPEDVKNTLSKLGFKIKSAEK